MEKDELPDGYKFGFCFSSFSIHMKRYLDYLYRLFLSRSGTVIERTLVSLQNIDRTISVDVIVNCCGLGR
jgi:hypothetical protein